MGGYTNLRYDDTNPEKETPEFIEKIQENIKWLGYEPKSILFASDYND
jgi:glutaminyl-tRNA synthetase